MQVDDLVFHDLHTAQQIVFRLKDGLPRIFCRQAFIVLPVKIAAVAIGVHVGQLEKTSLRTMRWVTISCTATSGSV